ncbi:MAG: hypothetical protein JW782_05495 [Candidatus Saganbacteria bacterium]|nr:hypothetical protein [Candidatus Saganbacteria bacterium]
MKRALFVIGLALIFAAASCAEVAAPPPRSGAFFPFYWIFGEATSSVPSISVDDRLVVVYEGKDDVITAVYGYAFIKNGEFVSNPFMTNILVPGNSYKVAIAQGADGYGADPVDINISGLGYDVLDTKLVLAYGAGPIAPGGEPAPLIKLWFGNRLYQPQVYNEKNPFVVAPDPLIKAIISIEEPYAIASDIGSYSIVIDPGTQDKALDLTTANMTAKSMAAGDLKSFTLEYALDDETEKLSEGSHLVRVTAQSAGTQGLPAMTTYLATVEVMGGPVRLIGAPITYPSPYSISKDKIVTIQYGLSSDANIEIYLVGVSGQRIKHWVLNAGQEGGSAGINKITWDGKTDQGYLAGNAIYVGTIVAREEGRLLGKFKLTIVD